MFSQALIIALSAITVSAQRAITSAVTAKGQHTVVAASANQDGAPVIMHNPYFEDDDKHMWTFQSPVPIKGPETVGPQPIKMSNWNKCLDVKDGIRAPGSKVQLWTCSSIPNPNQQWVVHIDGTFRWADTNLCLDMTDGNPNDGNQLQVWTCDPSNSNQLFDGPHGSTIATTYIEVPSFYPDVPKVLTVPSLDDGAVVSLGTKGSFTDTFPQGTQTWIIPPYSEGVVTGPFKTVAGDKCLDLPGGNTTTGTPLQIWACSEGNPNQQWTSTNVEDPKNVRLVGTSKCMEVADGGKIQIAECDGSEKQHFWV